MNSNVSFFNRSGFPRIGMLTVLAAFLIAGLQASGQVDQPEEVQKGDAGKSTVSLDFGADLVSRYIWRGSDYGRAPAVQPSISFSAYGLTVGAWGSYAFSRTSFQVNDSISVDGYYTETDLFISYTYKYFTLMLYDYYTPYPVDSLKGNNYFNWKNDETFHTLEASFIFDGPDKFPLRFIASVLFYGADKGKDSTGTYGMGSNNNYSTYFELSYNFEVKGIGIRPYIGGIPFGSAWYGPEAGITNVGLHLTKDIPITKQYALPVQANLMFNPLDKKAYLVFILSI